MVRYGLGDAYKRGGGVIGLYIPKERSDGMEDGSGRVQARYGVWCEGHQIHPVTKYS